MSRIIIFAAALCLVITSLLGAQGSELAAATATSEASLSTAGGSTWVVAVNLVIWSGLFLYLLSLHGKIRALEKKS